MQNPWEITWGPDGFLWVTEKTAGRVTRVHPSDGSQKTALRIDEVVATEGAQDGLLGMALHPQLLQDGDNQYVYLAYTYDADPASGALDRRNKITRYTYNSETEKLRDPVDLITGLPASNDHNSGRMAFGPDHKLYYTIGDQGNNQFANYCKPIRSQMVPTADEVASHDWTAYQGKILRLDLDGSVPADNPVIGGVRSHVYSYGHRNAQGIVFGPGQKLYANEHGPKTDDEINIIQAGGNYGWPDVLGYQDDKAYVYGNWSASQDVPCGSLDYDDYVIPESVPTQEESEFRHPDLVPPIKAFFTVPTGFDFRSPKCPVEGFLCWPTLAPSSLDVYAADDGVPGWDNSLLMPTLKSGTVYVLKLSADGDSIRGRRVPYWRTVNRYRDIAIDPDNRTFYVATDATGLARNRWGRPTLELENPGSILVFRYAPLG
ncbi:MAG: PQQ-dependent sugar dehydrogenase [Actinomycetota bacterium]|nr:PQQ-dependent sugar dehydrogenase [Actinomycetota bacterium]